MRLRDFMRESLNVSRETAAQLIRYEALINKWNPRINLIAKGSVQSLWSRHFKDSLQVFDLRRQATGYWLDLGSGGGFPGLIVAINASEAKNNLRVGLLESDQRKAAFLRSAAREMGLRVDVLNVRIEEAEPQNAQTITARALAPLDKLLGYVDRHLVPGGTALLPKGVTWEKEVENAKKHWRFDLRCHKSKTDPRAVILEIGDLKHV